MAKASKILSNIVGLSASRESCQGFLAGEFIGDGLTLAPTEPPAVWKKYEPNTYAASGATITTTAPNPINPTRQRNKGLVTDLEAVLGFNHDLSANNMADMFEAALFADSKSRLPIPANDISATPLKTGRLTNMSRVGNLIPIGFRAKSAKSLYMVREADGTEKLMREVASPPVPSDDFTASSSPEATLNLKEGDWIFIGGDTADSRYPEANRSLNGFKRILSVEPLVITFDKVSKVIVGEEIAKAVAPDRLEFYFGSTLNNATTPDDFRNNNTFQFERTLGENEAGKQSELITGCVLNEMSINFPAQGLANVDLGFVAKDQLLLPVIDPDSGAPYAGETNRKLNRVSPKTKFVGTEEDKPSLLQKDIFNTTSDISRMRMSKVTDGKIVPGDFFTYITEANITINNGVTPDKALSVLGSFDYSLGNFIVGGNVQAYFADVEAVRAVRDNSDVTMDYILVKNNAGLVFDLPLITLGDGQLNVEIDQSVRIPLNTEAAKSAFGYTMKIVSFPYLPDLADVM